MNRRRLIWMLPLGLCFAGLSTGWTKDKTPQPTITVQAGAVSRVESIATVDIPPDFQTGTWLKPESGRRIPIQMDKQGRGWFRVENLPAGSSRSYVLESIRKSDDRKSGCQLDFIGGALIFGVAGHPVVQYNQSPTALPRKDIKPIFRRGGYMHPVYSPSGLQISEDYPTNHIHHHGIWTAWTKTDFEGRHPDFWNMGDGTGTVVPITLDGFWDGPVQGGFRSTLAYQDLSISPRRTALDEYWEARVFALGGKSPKFFVFDLNLRQTCHTASDLELLEYRYGGLGVRGNAQWNGTTNTFFLTSNGETNRLKAHATKANWCAMSGRIDGKMAGVAILCHPGNLRAPQPMRVNPDEPFFCYSPTQSGPFKITLQKPYEARYRFVTFDGPPDAALLNQLWEDYAHPVESVFKAP